MEGETCCWPRLPVVPVTLPGCPELGGCAQGAPAAVEVTEGAACGGNPGVPGMWPACTAVLAPALQAWGGGGRGSSGSADLGAALVAPQAWGGGESEGGFGGSAGLGGAVCLWEEHPHPIPMSLLLCCSGTFCVTVGNGHLLSSRSH